MTHDAPRPTSGRLALPDSELSWRFSRSSGAGGQHVNTSDTRVELIWSLDDSTALSPAQKELAATRLAGRLVDGTITIVSSQYRSQHRNREAARVRLEELLARAVVPPRPRRATKPTRGSKERRLDAKKRRASIKQGRGNHGWE
jgi:ribosome-associated protein